MTNFRFLFERGIRIIESRQRNVSRVISSNSRGLSEGFVLESRQRNVSRVISSNSRGLSYRGLCQEKGVVCVQLHII